MNSKGDVQLQALSELANKNNLTISFLQKQIALGRLMFEKKGKSFYSTQSWVEQHKKDFTFDGFMLDRIFPRGSKKVSESKNSPKTEKTGKIVREEGVNIDLEQALVSKWNKEFKAINKDFENLAKTNKTHQKSVNKNKQNDLVSKPRNVHSAVLVVVILFLLSFYAVTLLPNTAKSFTNKLDSIVNAPHIYINKLALTKIIDEERASLNTDVPRTEQLSKYIKNKVSNISYPAGTTIEVSSSEINGRVAGIEEGFNNNDLGLIDRLKKGSLGVLRTISEKQKKASLKLNDKLNNIISTINH